MYKNNKNPKIPNVRIQNYVTKLQIYTCKLQIYTIYLQIYVYKSCRSIRSEEYKSEFTPRSEDLRLLLAKSNFKFKKN